MEKEEEFGVPLVEFLTSLLSLKSKGKEQKMSEHYVKRVHTEHAVLDIGQDIGALVLYTDEVLCSKEIEISPIGNDRQRTHTAIWERKANGRSVFAGIFPSLPAGDYTLWTLDGKAAGDVTIVGGQVSEVDWRSC